MKHNHHLKIFCWKVKALECCFWIPYLYVLKRKLHEQAVLFNSLTVLCLIGQAAFTHASCQAKSCHSSASSD